MLDQQLGGKPPYPAKKLFDPPAPDELEVVLDEQLGHRLGVPGGGGVLDRVLDKPVRTAPSRRAAAQPVRVPRARAPAAEARRTDGDSGTTPRRASRATRNMFERASSASTAAESSRPRTASHSSGVNRPSTEVRTRKSLVWGASAVRTSSVR